MGCNGESARSVCRRLCRCFRSWRLWAAQRRSAAHKVHHVRSRAEQRLASAVLQEWAELAWELPRERKAAALQVSSVVMV